MKMNILVNLTEEMTKAIVPPAIPRMDLSQLHLVSPNIKNPVLCWKALTWPPLAVSAINRLNARREYKPFSLPGEIQTAKSVMRMYTETSFKKNMEIVVTVVIHPSLFVRLYSITARLNFHWTVNITMWPVPYATLKKRTVLVFLYATNQFPIHAGIATVLQRTFVKQS